MNSLNLSEVIQYVDIGMNPNSDIVRYVQSGVSVFRLDILSARAIASDYYQRSEKSNLRSVFIKHGSIIFLITANETVQYQLLEAILDVIIQDFDNTYGGSCCDIAGAENMYVGYETRIPELFDVAQKQAVKWVTATCNACKADYQICVKKSLIENAQNFPVALVFFHHNHGMLLYIDANFKVRGAEIVGITG